MNFSKLSSTKSNRVVRFVISAGNIYILIVLTIWGFVEAFTYFQGDTLKKSLGNYWFLIYTVPLLIAAGIAFYQDRVISKYHFRYFDPQNFFAPTYSDFSDNEALEFLNQLDIAKRKSDRTWVKNQSNNKDLVYLREINDYVFKIFKSFWFIQKKWFQINNRYFQGKLTMPTIPDYKNVGKVEFSFGLTDQVDDWIDIGYVDEYAPIQLECHVYESPKGHGFTLFAKVKVKEIIWKNQMHIGPEENRGSTNYVWTQIS